MLAATRFVSAIEVKPLCAQIQDWLAAERGAFTRAGFAFIKETVSRF